MRHYELVVVFSPTVSGEDVSQAQERTEQFITNDGGEITKKEQWGLKRLAYPIRKSGQTFLEGNYFLTRFSTDTASPSELETHLRISESVLRYLLVRTATAIPPEPPPPRFAPRPQAPVVRTAEAEAVGAPQDVAAPTEAAEPAAEVTETLSEEAPTAEPAAEVTETPSEEAVTVEVEEPAVAEAPQAEPEPETETEESAPTPAEETTVEEKPAKAKKPRAKATTTKTSKTKASSTAKSTKTKAPKASKSSKSKESEE